MKKFNAQDFASANDYDNYKRQVKKVTKARRNDRQGKYRWTMVE